MKYLLLFVVFMALLTSCYSTRGSGYQEETAAIDPQVQLWLVKEHKAPHDKLSVIVRASAPLDYTFLTRIRDSFYTGRVTKEQLKILLHDERILRIRTGKKKLYKSGSSL